MTPSTSLILGIILFLITTGNAVPTVVVGEWSRWEPWSECSVTCGEGTKTRTRTCLNLEPQNGNVNCAGTSRRTRACNTDSCTVDGAWSSWGTWSDCSVTCGDGQKLRRRSCNNPAPAIGGSDCLPVGSLTDFESCTMKPCAINGGWSEWSAWDDSCSAEECNEEGLQIRIRSCSSPRPQHGGRYCQGNNRRYRPCINIYQACPVDGGWGEWGAYGECSETCGDFSYRERYRPCNNPAPRNNGKDCPGRSAEAQDCPGVPPCPIEAPASGDCADDEDADCEFSGDGSGAESTPHPCSAFDTSYSYALCIFGDIDPPDVPGNEGGPAPDPCSVFEDSYSYVLCKQGDIDPPDVPGNAGGPAPEPDNYAFEYSDDPQGPVDQPAGNPPQEPADEGGPAPDPCSVFEDSYSYALCKQGDRDPPDVSGNEGGPAPVPDNNAFDYSYSMYSV